jgi:hypothetical protein
MESNGCTLHLTYGQKSGGESCGIALGQFEIRQVEIQAKQRR